MKEMAKAKVRIKKPPILTAKTQEILISLQAQMKLPVLQYPGVDWPAGVLPGGQRLALSQRRAALGADERSVQLVSLCRARWEMDSGENLHSLISNSARTRSTARRSP